MAELLKRLVATASVVAVITAVETVVSEKVKAYVKVKDKSDKDSTQD